jgi:hypothetical protein
MCRGALHHALSHVALSTINPCTTRAGSSAQLSIGPLEWHQLAALTFDWRGCLSQPLRVCHEAVTLKLHFVCVAWRLASVAPERSCRWRPARRTRGTIQFATVASRSAHSRRRLNTALAFSMQVWFLSSVTMTRSASTSTSVTRPRDTSPS